MPTIGTFHRQTDGSYSGAIRTLTLNLEQVQFRSVEREGDNAPDYRIFAGPIEIGAAWKKTSRGNRPYLSVKLDDPSFALWIYASLVEAQDGHNLIWSRARFIE
jgi:uncharacterized protein (DUF736 family)